MARSKIVQYPLRPSCVDEQKALWHVGIHRLLEDTYSCTYSSEHKRWEVYIETSAPEKVPGLAEQCRHVLGWDILADKKKVATQ